MSTPLHRMTIMTALACALLAATLSGPAAADPNPIDSRTEAQPPDIHAGLSDPAARPFDGIEQLNGPHPSAAQTAPKTQSKQDLRSPDTRDAARATTPSDPNAARPETAGNPNVTTDAHRGFGLARDIQAGDAALAQERYYSTHGEPEPLPVAEAPTPVDEDTPWLPIALAIAATLTIVAASATHLRRLRIRRRRTAGAVS
jgi:hypothetical protein